MLVWSILFEDMYSKAPRTTYCKLTRTALVFLSSFIVLYLLGHLGCRSWALDSIPPITQLDLSTFQALINSPGQEIKGLFHVVTRFGWSLDVRRSQLACKLFCLSSVHGSLSVLVPVTLVSHQHEEHCVGLHTFWHLRVPLLHIFERFTVAQIEYQKTSDWVTVVGASHRPENVP